MDITGLDTKDCIRTHSGIYINVFEPTLEMIDIHDIAHALSNQCRFAGHLPRFYSVAQHSVLCSYIVEPENAFAALMHDASEAYLLDIPSPIKARMPEYKLIENKLMLFIAQKYGFEYPMNKDVVGADVAMLQTEWNAIVLGNDMSFECWSAAEAKAKFLERFAQLTDHTKFIL